jgi:phosphoglycolate phosphatase
MPERGRMIHCIAFDFDGTLVDSNEIKRKTFFDVSCRFIGGEKIMDSALSDSGVGDRYSVFEIFSRKMTSIHKNDQINASHLVEEYTILCEKKISQAPEMDGIWYALPALADSGIKLVISSATPEATLRRIVSIRKLANFFSHVFGAPETKEEHIMKIMHYFQCGPKQIVYVGDSEIDQAAAKNQGCHFIGVGKDKLRFDTEPEIFLPTLKLLPQMVEKINRQ